MQVIPYSELTEDKARAGCFVSGMPNADYHQYPGISNSGLNLVARSPAHYAYRSAFKQTRHMEIGTAFHTALLEPERFAREYMIVRGINDRRKSEYREASKVYTGERALTDSEGAAVEVMVESVRSNPDAHAVLSEPGYAELSAFVEDPETGILMRCRFDWLTETGRAVDVKKTQDCRQRPFQRAIHAYRYHCQEAMYSHVYELITGKPLESYQFLAIEEQPPCANVMYTLDALAKAHGHKEYRDALLAYTAAVKSGEWPGYGVNSDLISLPEYVLMEIDAENDELGNMTFTEE